MFYYSRGPHVEKIRPGCPTPPTRSGISNRTRTRDPLLYLGKAVSGTQTGHRRGQMGDRGVENTRRKKLVLQWTSVNGWWPTVWRREEEREEEKAEGNRSHYRLPAESCAKLGFWRSPPLRHGCCSWPRASSSRRGHEPCAPSASH
jgi:hypothetical protein